jgi:hypothetical protein
MKEPEEELTEGEKDWLDMAKKNPWLFSNYGDVRKDVQEDEEDSDDCSETSFQKFCDYSGNNRYPTE